MTTSAIATFAALRVIVAAPIVTNPVTARHILIPFYCEECGEIEFFCDECGENLLDISDADHTQEIG